MDATIALLNESGRWLVAQLGRMSVELAVLAGIVLAALYVLRVKSPALRHLFWGLLLAKPLVTFLVASPLSLYAFLWPPQVFIAPASVVVQMERLPIEAPAPSFPSLDTAPSVRSPRPVTPPFWRKIDRYGVASALWAIVASVLGLRLLLGCAYVAFLRSTARTHVEDCLSDLVCETRQALRVRRRVRIATTTACHGPVLAGIFRPIILLPETMAAALTPQQLRLVITHEVAHARRWDNLVLLLQRFAEMFFFFHPVIWCCGWMMRREAEAACDDIVVSAYGDADGAGAAAYADSLTRVAEMKCGITRRLLVNTFAAAESNFNRRIRRILSGRRTRMTLWLTLATGAALVLIGILGLPTVTSAPQQPAKQPEQIVSAITTRPEMPAEVQAALTKQKITATVDSVDKLVELLSMASGVSFVAADVPSFPPVWVSEANPLQLMEQVVEKSGKEICFIVRPYGILIANARKVRTISGASIPPKAGYLMVQRTGGNGPRPAWPESVEQALTRQPLTLSGSQADAKLSSLVETFSISSELTFVLEREFALNPYWFEGKSAKDVMLALTDMTRGEVCFVLRDYGILAASRGTAARLSGSAIPEDLPWEEIEEEAGARPPLPDQIKQRLTKEPVDFELRPEALHSGGDLAKVLGLASGLQLDIDGEALQKREPARSAAPFLFMKNGNSLDLMQALVEATNGALCFVLTDASRLKLTDFEKGRALQGPGIQLAPPEPALPEGSGSLIGVTITNVQPHEEELHLADGKGALVREVLAGSPAETAGIRKRDVIRKVNGTPVPNIKSFVQQTRALPLSTSARMEIWRDGAAIELDVVPLAAQKVMPSRYPETSSPNPSSSSVPEAPNTPADGQRVTVPVTEGPDPKAEEIAKVEKELDKPGDLETRFYELGRGEEVVKIVGLLKKAVPDVLETGTGKCLSSMVWLPETHQLIVHNAPANLSLLEGLLAEMPAAAVGKWSGGTKPAGRAAEGNVTFESIEGKVNAEQVHGDFEKGQLTFTGNPVLSTPVAPAITGEKIVVDMPANAIRIEHARANEVSIPSSVLAASGAETPGPIPLIVAPLFGFLGDQLKAEWQSQGLATDQAVFNKLQEATMDILRKRLDTVGMQDVPVEKLAYGRIAVGPSPHEDAARVGALAVRPGILRLLEAASREETIRLLEEAEKDARFHGRALSPFDTTAQRNCVTVAAGRLAAAKAIVDAINSADPKLLPDGETFFLGSKASPDALYLINKNSSLSKVKVRSAEAIPDPDNPGRAKVSFTLSDDDAQRFGDLTQSLIGKGLAILVDWEIQSVPVVRDRITQSGQIAANYTPKEAADLAACLSTLEYPVPLIVLCDPTSTSPPQRGLNLEERHYERIDEGLLNRLLRKSLLPVYDPDTGQELSSANFDKDTGRLTVRNLPDNLAVFEALLAQLGLRGAAHATPKQEPEKPQASNKSADGAKQTPYYLVSPASGGTPVAVPLQEPTETPAPDTSGTSQKRTEGKDRSRSNASTKDVWAAKMAARRWWPAFQKAYGLSEGEILKRIAPPYIPERHKNCRYTSVSSDPSMLSLCWSDDGKLLYEAACNNITPVLRRSEYFAEKSPADLKTVLRMLNLLEPDLAIASSIEDRKVPGDWSLRNGTPLADLMKRFETILREELGWRISISPRQEERDVVVVQGLFKFQPLNGKENVQVYIDDPESEMLKVAHSFGVSVDGAGCLNTEHFFPPSQDPPPRPLVTLSNTMGIPFLYDTQAQFDDTNQRGTIWEISEKAASLHNEPNSDQKYANLARLLQNIEKQTGLRLAHERRMRTIWHVEEQ